MEDEENSQNMDEPELDEEDLRFLVADQDFDDDNSPGQDSQELPEDNEDDDGRASPVSHSRPRNDSPPREDPSKTSPRKSPGPPKTSKQHPDQQRPGIFQHSQPSLNTQPPQPGGILTRTAHLPLDYGKWTSSAGRATRRRSKRRKKPPSFLAEVMPDKTTMCFFFVNFLFMTVGCIVIALVVATLFTENNYSMLFRLDMGEEDHMGFLHSVGVAAITTGIAIVGLCFLGCVGVVRRKKRILCIYTYSVVAVIVLQVVAVAIALYYGNATKRKIEGTLLQELAEVYDGQLNSNNSFSKAFDYAQVFFGCCGVNSYTDFKKTPWYKKANKIRNDREATYHEANKFPLTCCRLKDKQQFLADLAAGGDVSATLNDPDCLTRVPSRDNEYTEVSCLEAIIQFFTDKSTTMLCMAVVVVCLQAAGVISAMAIEHDIDKCEARLRQEQHGVHT
ncbi:tetraspanin-33-like [Littorina saxatilis]|uniref:tetraspanin-33-like n=1 Tax=Littorina saxatilis TaxID=31220 RepID=UPI0038B48183